MSGDADSDIDINYEVQDLQHALRSANLELSLERSKHSVEVVVKDEEIRKLRVTECLLRSEVNDLHEQLGEEQARADELEKALEDALTQVDEHKSVSETTQNQIRVQSREVANLRAEIKAMENVTSDSDKILSEKLALSRELSSLRPEVDHLRAQVESNQGLLAEKLALQRQLSTLQVEFENEKRSNTRTLNKMEQEKELREKANDIHKELAKEKKERMELEGTHAEAKKTLEEVQTELEAAQHALERQQAKAAKKESKTSKRDEANVAALEELRQKLEEEKAHRETASQTLINQVATIESLQEQLQQERKERQKVEKASDKAAKKSSQQTDNTAEEIRKELEEEKRERKKQDKEHAKAMAELQGRNTVLDDKLAAFRDKLRTTKEKLKEKEAELERSNRAQTAPPTKAGSDAVTKPVKAVRKRMATAEPETNLGTPGDGFPQKKMKRPGAAIGDTSAFSLTPFLNRNAPVAPASPIVEEEEEEEEGAAAPAEATPTVAQPKKMLKKSAPPQIKSLAPAAKPRKKAASVAPEPAPAADTPSSRESSPKPAPAPRTIPLKPADDGTAKPAAGPRMKSKPRKSLMSFATFAEEPAAEKKKKRKLGASAGKTLFDAEDVEDAAPVKSKPTSSKGLFAARALSKGGLKGRPISGGFGMMSEEAFTFSPLKKDRRGASILK